MDNLEYHSQAYVTSTKKQSMLMTIKGKHFFIEFPQNLFPNPKQINTRRNLVSEVDENTMNILKEGFEAFGSSFTKYPYLRFPDFIRGFCISKKLSLEDYNILE